MTAYELTVFISTLAFVVADATPDNDDLGLIASMLVQLGDTLDTIATRREMCESRSQKAECCDT